MTVNPDLGDLIAELGAALERGDVARDDAIARLVGTGDLSAYGAEVQLRAWRGAPGRYRAAAADGRVRVAAPADVRALMRRQELHFPAAGNA